MRRIKQIFITLVLILFGALLHYVLPQHDIVKITSTEIIRTDFSSLNRIFYAQADSGSAASETRDLRLINTQKKKTWLLGFYPRDKMGVMVYRNEDTGWIWPPYFKFDSADLQAEAAANIAPGQERWVVVTHYGWRNKYLSIYPNAIGIRPVEGPDVTVIPWFNIVFFAFLLFCFGFLRAVWRQFRQRTVDPALESAEDTWDAVGDGMTQRRNRFSRWLDTWRSK
ncbi:DUF1523 family protein [Phaeobacter sp. 22II1-1F12B]|uniref:DUF1523 family protein n=1 Tax=Phaeobacter sp. 22II1-1F12B TaxID=1317111 RepID=UPI000B52301B|nr:DUF1523 family protein [Phaeobacter sp. 22II1-1F12B]OWU82444.1 hypothetical protein ATO1_00500 [Phaeobacter sp. 22II1-1F12B]